MPYGAEFRNNGNVTIIDDTTSAATVRPNTYTYDQEAPNQEDYFFNPYLLEQGIPAIRIDSQITSLYSMPNSDTGGIVYGSIPGYSITGVNGSLPDTYPAKFITSFGLRGSSSDSYGMRIWDGNGNLTFDAGHAMARPFRSVDVVKGTTLNLPSTFWYLPTSVYMHWTGQWRRGGGIKRVSGNTWEADIYSIGISAPADGTRVGHFFIFDTL